MKVLLVVDGSSYTGMSTRMVWALHLPPKTAVTVMTVVPEHTFLGGVTLSKFRSTRKEVERQKALELVQSSAKVLRGNRLKVDSLVRWGNPAEEILKESEKSRASLVVVGARGLTDPLPFRLGSVAQTVMKHSKASVLLVRATATTQNLAAPRARAGINRVILATDGSRYSQAVVQFLLDLPLPKKCEVIVITALQSHLAALMKTPTLDFQANQELLARLQASEESEARKITGSIEGQFQARGLKAVSVVLRGGAAECILAAAREYNPDIIALGSRGLSGIESLLLGSVAERVARYANGSVLIVRAPAKIGDK
jgi:nucleotide-binding universal stress UspA family protein